MKKQKPKVIIDAVEYLFVKKEEAEDLFLMPKLEKQISNILNGSERLVDPLVGKEIIKKKYGI